jgi:hypothetical protein
MAAVIAGCGFVGVSTETRHFTFRYGFTVNNVPAGEPVREFGFRRRIRMSFRK